MSICRIELTEEFNKLFFKNEEQKVYVLRNELSTKNSWLQKAGFIWKPMFVSGCQKSKINRPLRDETQNYTLFLVFIDERMIRTRCNFQDQRSNFTRLFQSSYSTSFLPENHASLFVTVDNVGNDKPFERLRARRKVLPVIRWSSNFAQSLY